MTVARYVQSAFNRGELDPYAHGRGDVEWYGRACARARNVVTLPLGPARRRAGLRHVAGALGDGRLRSFVFSAAERYLFVFSDLRLDIYRDDDGAPVWNGAAPWTLAELSALNTTQYADTMVAVHPLHNIRQIVRQSETNWTISEIEWPESNGRSLRPFHKYAAPNVTMASSATATGAASFTASADHFVAGHVGLRVRMAGGEATVDAITSPTQADVTITAALASAAATRDWSEQAFSDLRGYPATATFHRNRLALAGGARPTTAWLSSARDVFDFDEGDASDDDAVTLTLLGNSLDDIRQMLSLADSLLLFTVSAEWALTGQVITPRTAGATPYTGYGAANVRPVIVEEAALFLSAPEAGRHALLELTYDAVSEAFVAQDVSLVAGHLLADCRGMAYRQGDARTAANHVYVVNGDGTLGLLNTMRRQDVTGWSLLTTDGAVRAVEVIGANAYCLVDRAGAWSIEVFDDLHFLDASVRATADPPATAWSGLDHLEGQTVQMRGDGVRLADAVVSGGAVATAFAVSELEVGLGYEWEIVTLPPSPARINRASLQTDWRVSHVSVDLFEAAGVQVDGEVVTPRVAAVDAWDGPVPIVTGQRMATRLGYADPAQVRIHGADPMPATIRGVVFWVS